MNLDMERRWLVKSDNKIVGPYTFEQLEDLLFKKQVSLIDEVRDMNCRWLYIREIPELKDMVEKVRHELDKKSDQTRTIQTSLQSRSGVSNETRTAEITNLEFTKNNAQFTDVSVESQDIEFKEVDFFGIENKSFESRNKKNIPNFVSSEDPKIRSNLNEGKMKAVAIFIFSTLFIVISIAGLYFYKKSNQEKNEKNLITKVRKLMIYGADSKAIEFFQKLPEYLHSKVLPDILPLVSRLDAEGLINLNDTLQQIQKNPNLTMSQKSEIQLVQFNKAVVLNNLSAAKTFLIQARDFDPGSDVVKENEAIVSSLEMNDKDSKSQFLELFNKSNKGRYLVGYALGHLKKNDITDIELSEKIERYLAIRVEYKKELLLCQIILSLKLNNLPVALRFVDEYISTPIQLASKFRLHPLVYNQIYKYEKFIAEYNKIKQALPPKLLGLIDLHLSLENGDGYAAEKVLDKIQDQLSKVEKINAQIAINSVLNRYSENIAIEKTAATENLNISSHLILLKSKIENQNTDYLKNADVLRKEKNIIALWSDLLVTGEGDPARFKAFLQNNSMNAEDFIPYIDAKVRFE